MLRHRLGQDPGKIPEGQSKCRLAPLGFRQDPAQRVLLGQAPLTWSDGARADLGCGG